jgi:putative adenylate-forming enzyme
MLFKLRIFFHYLVTRYLRRFKSRSELERYQERRISRHLRWVKRHSKFYREWSGGMIDKKIMMEHFTDLNTVGVDRDQAFDLAFRAEASRDFTPTLNGVTVGLSSGTSGNRGLFLVSDSERARHAGTLLAKILPDSILDQYRVAFFMRANSNLYTASSGSRILFEFYDLLSPIEDHLERLESQRPDLLFAPPSMLIRLAEARAAGRIPAVPRRIFSIAETLDPLDERRMTAAFGMKVHQIYQCTEGFLAASCEHGTLHLNEDCVRIDPEWLDETRTKFMPIITDFTRTSQPVIRYRLNDILTLRSTPCPCGSVMTALESIEGRSDDVLRFKRVSGGEPVAVFPDFIRRAVITADEAIEEYLVTQARDGELDIHLKVMIGTEQGAVRNRIELEISNLADRVGALRPEIRFHEGIPSFAGKKLRRVLRL